MENSSNGSNYGKTSIVTSNKGMPIEGIRIENPFTFKALQLFTGFGIGCGAGIGVGQPMDLHALPIVGQLMSSARGATNSFSGVTRHVNNALWKLGAKNVKVGVGCGVGFGYGFGVGLAVKPSAVQKIQALLVQVMTKMMTKLGATPGLSIDQGAHPMAMQSSMNIAAPSIQNPIASLLHPAANLKDQSSQGLHGYGNMDSRLNHIDQTSKSNPIDTSFGSRTESVISNFLQNPILKEDDTNQNEVAGRFLLENKILRMVLRHQQIIEELMEDNKKLRRILEKDLKISPNKLQRSYSTGEKSPCSECFECRRKQRKR